MQIFSVNWRKNITFSLEQRHVQRYVIRKLEIPPVQVEPQSRHGDRAELPNQVGGHEESVHLEELRIHQSTTLWLLLIAWI